MKEISYVVNNTLGIHARPAALLAPMLREFQKPSKNLFRRKSC